MSLADAVGSRWSKRRLVYALMVILGAVFVSTTVLPVAEPIAQLLAVLTFGVMSGLWLAHLVYSL